MAQDRSSQSAKATIADVAALAQVSIKTVSRVFNKEPNVRDGTRLKVMQAIESLNYRPDPSARSLAGRRSFLIGLIYDNPSASYLIDVQTGALTTSRAEGYDLIIHPCDYSSPTLAQDIGSMVLNTKVDGLILTPPLADLSHLIKALDEQQVALVRVAPADQTESFRSVYTNDRAACAQLTEYLISMGHSRIGFITGHPDHKAVGNRLLGYKDALSGAGIEYDGTLVMQGYNSFESGGECAVSLLSREHPPTAIFASNDDMAAGVMKVAHQRGLRIPEDLSVAGFDDIPLASYLWPALTTIRQPIHTMAQTATRLLLSQLRNHTEVEETQVITSRLVVRESTGPANND